MEYNLEERTAVFAEKIISLCKRAKNDNLSVPVVSQLVRSGTSIGANYREANGASSRKDFMNKIFVCKKESKETEYWLRLLAHIEKNLTTECRRLWQEVHEFTLIFSKISGKQIKIKN